MSKARTLVYAFMSFCCIMLGVFVLFKVWWSKTPDSFFGMAGYALIVGSAYFFTLFLFKFFLPPGFGFTAAGAHASFAAMKKQYGAPTVWLFLLGFFSVFMLTVAGAGYVCIVSVKQYERYHLNSFGEAQKVRIKKIDYKSKGTPYAFFDFTFNGQTFSEELPPKNLQEGDSAIILFSTEDPRVVVWAEDFKKE